MNPRSPKPPDLVPDIPDIPGINWKKIKQIANPSVPALYEDALVYETGSAITSSGALSAYSGAKTGRSPSDKRVVKEEGSEKDVWWGPVNKPMSPEVSSIQQPRCVALLHLKVEDTFLHVSIPKPMRVSGVGWLRTSCPRTAEWAASFSASRCPAI